jgi:hypothetical protein
MTTETRERTGPQLIYEEGSDPIVAQAIRNVTSEQALMERRGTSPRQITQAIYDEIRRLDRARVNETMSPVSARIVRFETPNGMAGPQ